MLLAVVNPAEFPGPDLYSSGTSLATTTFAPNFVGNQPLAAAVPLQTVSSQVTVVGTTTVMFTQTLATTTTDTYTTSATEITVVSTETRTATTFVTASITLPPVQTCPATCAEFLGTENATASAVDRLSAVIKAGQGFSYWHEIFKAILNYLGFALIKDGIAWIFKALHDQWKKKGNNQKWSRRGQSHDNNDDKNSHEMLSAMERGHGGKDKQVADLRPDYGEGSSSGHMRPGPYGGAGNVSGTPSIRSRSTSRDHLSAQHTIGSKWARKEDTGGGLTSVREDPGPHTNPDDQSQGRSHDVQDGPENKGGRSGGGEAAKAAGESQAKPPGKNQ